MANWIPFTPGRVLAEPMDEAASYLLSAVNLIGDLLTLSANILKIVSKIIVALLDPIAIALQTLVNSIKAFLNDLLNTGFYFWGHAPLTTTTALHFSEWLAKAASSLELDTKEADPTDSGDPVYFQRKPNFSQDAYVGAMVLCVAFPTFKELIDWWNSFILLFREDKFNFVPPAHLDIKDDLAPGKLVTPHWDSLTLKDIKPMREALQHWIEALDKFTKIQQITDIVDQFASFLERKGQEFKDFADKTQTVIRNLIIALEQTGVWCLPIYGRGGNALVKSALLNMDGSPATVKSTSQEGAEKAIDKLRQELGGIASISHANNFASPNNRDNSVGNAIDKQLSQTIADTDAMLDSLEDNIRMNPQGRLTTLVDKALMSDAQKRAYNEKRKAGYPDEAAYFNPVPSVNTYAQNTGSTPAGISELVIRTSRDGAQEYLNGINEDPKLKNPIKYTTVVDHPFGYTVSKNSTEIKVYGFTVATFVKTTGIYFYGNFDGTSSQLADIATALDSLKEQTAIGCPVVIDCLSLIFPQLGGKDDQAVVDLFTSTVSLYIKNSFYDKAGDIIIICPANMVSAFTDLANYLDNLANSGNLTKPGINGEGDKTFILRKRVNGTANDVGTRSAGEALGTAISDALPSGGAFTLPSGPDGESMDLFGEQITRNITDFSYDENGKLIMRTRKVAVGSRFEPTRYPTFAGNDNWTIGCIIMTGGPSEAAAESLFNLLGISVAAGQTAFTGVVAAADQVVATGADFNNFSENIQYNRAKEKNSGSTLQFP